MEKINAPTPIAILMATYNGEKYIKEQIDSLLEQTCKDWTLYIHDDESKDQTPQILQQYAQQYHNIIVLNYESQKGAMRNFFSLLQRVEAQYYMFCDQDDVWLKEKVALSLEEMQHLEAKHPQTHIAVYTDLYVTDEKLNITNHSFWQEICLYPEFITNFDEIAASTAITGCAMLFNQQAKECIMYPATHATMHDAWIAACILKRGGLIHPIYQQMVYYRQHETNCVGATNLNHLTLAYRIKNFKEMQLKNWHLFRMLQSLDYGSIFKFFKFKLIYKNRIHRKISAQ